MGCTQRRFGFDREAAEAAPGMQGTYVVVKCLSVLVWSGVVLVFASGC